MLSLVCGPHSKGLWLVILNYGIDSSLALDLPAERLLAICDSPAGTRLTDVAPALERALAEPLGFPPLAQAVVPQDRVTLALEPGVPRAAEIIGATVDYLCRAGADACDITVLRTQEDAEAGAEDPRSRLGGDSGVHLATHQPDDRAQLMYLAATRKGRPIYLNRALCDADVVMPIGCLRAEPAIAYHGVYGGLYPTFSDTKTLARFRNPHLIEPGSELVARARHEVDVVGWLAGMPFSIQVLPGGNDSILDVFAGDATAVDEHGRQRSRAAWHFKVPHRAELVVCAIAGGRAQQTWNNVGRAVAAALRVVSDGGAIALVTDLATPPGSGMQRLVDAEDLPSALANIGHERDTDALAAAELGTALDRVRVYLLSRLDASSVEDLGIAPIEQPNDVGRLAGRAESCIVLANAQYTVATPLVD